MNPQRHYIPAIAQTQPRSNPAVTGERNTGRVICVAEQATPFQVAIDRAPSLTKNFAEKIERSEPHQRHLLHCFPFQKDRQFLPKEHWQEVARSKLCKSLEFGADLSSRGCTRIGSGGFRWRSKRISWRQLDSAIICPAAAMADEHIRLGCGSSAAIVAENSAEQQQQLILTANQDTVYMSGLLDLRNGSMVLELPRGLLGTLNNIWQQPLCDLGGPFSPEQNRGGRFLILPPGYDGPVPPFRHHVVEADTNILVFYLRAIPQTRGV